MENITIVKPIPLPNAKTGCAVDYPEWIGETCVGLVLGLAIHGQENKGAHLMGLDAWKFYVILPDDLIAVLTAQNPQPRSKEAADWIKVNDYRGATISFPKECFDRHPRIEKRDQAGI